MKKKQDKKTAFRNRKSQPENSKLTIVCKGFGPGLIDPKCNFKE